MPTHSAMKWSGCRADEARVLDGRTEPVGAAMLAERDHLLPRPPLAAVRYLLTEAGLHKGQAHVIDVGELARYDRPMPTLAEYDVLLSGPCLGTA